MNIEINPRKKNAWFGCLSLEWTVFMLPYFLFNYLYINNLI